MSILIAGAPLGSEREAPLMGINSKPAVRQPRVTLSLLTLFFYLQMTRMVIGQARKILGKNKLGKVY
jgi:hypothetical protein